jgi:CRISPR-associated endonuclease/helicase Cas3
MATSDGMFGRVKRWADRAAETGGRLQSIYLAHGKAHLNEEFEGIGVSNENVGDEGADNITVNDWTRGRKKGMLANFVVGTIDQLLFMALMMKHLALRHLALAGKVIVVDECHAFDAYMNGYLTQALKWLGKYRTPVVILSATLPGRTRRRLIEAYLGADSGAARENDEPAWVTNRAYPVITYTDGAEVKQKTVLARSEGAAVRIEYLEDERIAEKLDELLQDGGCAGVICDTVGRAQAMFESLGKHFNDGDVKLVHSRFLSIDRAAKESELRKLLGPDATLENGERPQKLIVVGTQVLEQSLDIDFDVLISDIAPMDLLIQRIGRLHRHRRRSRPQKLQAARCFITGVASRDDMLFEEVIENIYPRYLLMNTVLLLPDSIALPADISPLVQSAYDDRSADVDERLAERYAAAKGTYDFTVDDKEARARAFQIRGPDGGVHRNMVDWIDVERDDANDKKAEASVRDTEDNLEVIVLWRDGTGRLRLFPWIEERENLGDYELHPGYAPEESVARALAVCTVSLPLHKDWQIDGAIRELESSGPPDWQESHWLAGELFLILDEEFRCELIGFDVKYGWETGLQFHYGNPD